MEHYVNKSIDSIVIISTGTFFLKTSKLLRHINREIPWYKDKWAIICGSIGSFSLFYGLHSAATLTKLPMCTICKK